MKESNNDIISPPLHKLLPRRYHIIEKKSRKNFLDLVIPSKFPLSQYEVAGIFI
nr:MAG TPA: hypothetical protein [Caudoviricetes sp.]